MTHTGTSSLRSGSAGGRAGWSGRQRPGYSVDRQRDAHLFGRKKELFSVRTTGQKVCSLVIVFKMTCR